MAAPPPAGGGEGKCGGKGNDNLHAMSLRAVPRWLDTHRVAGFVCLGSTSTDLPATLRVRCGYPTATAPERTGPWTPPTALAALRSLSADLGTPLTRTALLLPLPEHELSASLTQEGVLHVLLGGVGDAGGDADPSPPTPAVAMHASSLGAFIRAVLGRDLDDPRLTFGPYALDPQQVFLEQRNCVAFVNLRPVLPGHVLVMPRRRVPRFTDMTAGEVAALWQTAQKVARVLERHHGCEASTFTLQDGPHAGQSVPHVHVHVIPRRPGDFRENDDIYPAIDKAEAQIASRATAVDAEERPPRSAGEMAVEAACFAALPGMQDDD